MVELTFGQVDAALAKMNHVADHKRVAFTGRLKFLQKHGIPDREGPGRGKRGTFSFDNFIQMAIAVELLQCGISPSSVALMVKSNWWLKHDEIYAAVQSFSRMESSKNPEEEDAVQLFAFPWVWQVHVEELADLRVDSKIDATQPIYAIPVRELARWSRMRSVGRYGVRHDYRRTIILNPADIIGSALAVMRVKGFLSIPDVLAEYDEMEEGLPEAAARFLQSMRGDEEILEWRSAKLIEIGNLAKSGEWTAYDERHLRQLIRSVWAAVVLETNLWINRLIKMYRDQSTAIFLDDPELPGDDWKFLIDIGMIEVVGASDAHNGVACQLTNFSNKMMDMTYFGDRGGDVRS